MRTRRATLQSNTLSANVLRAEMKIVEFRQYKCQLRTIAALFPGTDETNASPRQSMPDAKIPISIVIPTFNRSDFVRNAVRSAIDALPAGGEVIVTDDGDVEATKTVLADFDHSALKITKNTGQPGPGANRNHGANNAQGDILLFLDDDDKLFPSYPKRILKAVEVFPDAVWGFSSTEKHKVQISALPEQHDTENMDSFEPAASGNRFAGLGCGFWLRRPVFDQIGGISEDLGMNEDTDFSLKMMSGGYVPLYSRIAGVSLFVGDRVSLTKSAKARSRADCFQKILQRHEGFLQTNPDAMAFVLHRFLKHAGRARMFEPGMRAANTGATLGQKARNHLIFAANVIRGE